MPFSDAFSIANPFAINPELSNTPQAQAKKHAQAKAQAPQNNVMPTQSAQDEYAGLGFETLAIARSSPLLEALSSPKAETPQRQAMPNYTPPPTQIPKGFTPQTWAFQQALYAYKGIGYDNNPNSPTYGQAYRAVPGQPSVGGYLSANAPLLNPGSSFYTTGAGGNLILKAGPGLPSHFTVNPSSVAAFATTAPSRALTAPTTASGMIAPAAQPTAAAMATSPVAVGSYALTPAQVAPMVNSITWGTNPNDPGDPYAFTASVTINGQTVPVYGAIPANLRNLPSGNPAGANALAEGIIYDTLTTPIQVSGGGGAGGTQGNVMTTNALNLIAYQAQPQAASKGEQILSSTPASFTVNAEKLQPGSQFLTEQGGSELLTLAPGATKTLEVSLESLLGQASTAVDKTLTSALGQLYQAPQEFSGSLPIVYQGVAGATPIIAGFEGESGQTVGSYAVGDYLFSLSNGQLSYIQEPNAQIAQAQANFNNNPTQQNALALTNATTAYTGQKMGSSSSTAEPIALSGSQTPLANAPALYDMTTAGGNTPTALPTQGTAGQYNAQFVGLPLASSNVGIGTAATPPSSTQYTNTTQASSSGVTPIIKHLFMLLNYKFFALFSSLYLLSIYRVVSYD